MADFDAAAYKANLAAALEGVEAGDVTLTVTAASVRVTATVVAASRAVANRTLATLNSFTPETLSAACGVTVEAVAPPVLEQSDDVAGPDLNAGDQLDSLTGAGAITASGEGLSQQMLFGTLVGVALVLVCMLAMLGFCCWRGCSRTSGMHKMEVTVTSTSFDALDSVGIFQTKSSGAFVPSNGGAIDRARAAKAKSEERDVPHGPRHVRAGPDMGPVTLNKLPSFGDNPFVVEDATGSKDDEDLRL